jgi:hypothetical protein
VRSPLSLLILLLLLSDLLLLLESLLLLLLLELLLELELLELLLLLLLLELLSLRLTLEELSLRLVLSAGRVLSSLRSTSRRACARAAVDGERAVTQSKSKQGARNAPVSLLRLVVLMGCLQGLVAGFRASGGRVAGRQRREGPDAGLLFAVRIAFGIYTLPPSSSRIFKSPRRENVRAPEGRRKFEQRHSHARTSDAPPGLGRFYLRPARPKRRWARR